ncbi:hypothetical protein [Faecalibacillus intestinalis]|jgi:regulator of protease activity HflC (stomatin/prohibitin superfamily)|uniref:hypothetical protein n=1 Tax=Faecalibacillus intestinalis TaxID=1982626 RepID=UPI0011C0F259
MKYLLLVFFDGEEVIAYKTLVSYENDQSVLIDHQDIKRRRDIVKKARWDELARYDDMKKELDAQLAEAKMKAAEAKAKAAAEAETKAKAEFVLKLFKSKYLNEETKWLEDLTEYQYDQIFKKLIEDASLEEIKKIIGD